MTIAPAAVIRLIAPLDADVQARLDGRAWGVAASGRAQPRAVLDEPAALRAHGERLTALLRARRRALARGHLPEPLLPADGTLAARTRACALWCAGVLHGLHAADPRRLATLDAQALEAYADLEALAGARAPARVSEAAETALADLAEHARVAVALLAAALRPSPGEP